MYLEPDYGQVPESDHANLGWRISEPCFCILDSHDVHKMENELHREQARQKAKCVSHKARLARWHGPSKLRKRSERVGWSRIRLACQMKSLKVMIGPAMYRGEYNAYAT